MNKLDEFGFFIEFHLKTLLWLRHINQSEQASQGLQNNLLLVSMSDVQIQLIRQCCVKPKPDVLAESTGIIRVGIRQRKLKS